MGKLNLYYDTQAHLACSPNMHITAAEPKPWVACAIQFKHYMLCNACAYSIKSPSLNLLFMVGREFNFTFTQANSQQTFILTQK